MNEATLVIPVSGQLFQFGNVAITPAAMQALSPNETADALSRHASGDWGTVCEEDWDANDLALSECGRILSTYESKAQTVFWIITEWNRSVTTILLPSDY